MSEEETTPTGTVNVCPACGAEYEEPTECANGHPPTATIEHDAATLAAARSGDEEAAQKIADAASAAGIGSDAGAVHSEATVVEPEQATPAEPAPAEPVPAEPVPAPAETTAGSSPLTDALTAAKLAIEDAIAHASGQ